MWGVSRISSILTEMLSLFLLADDVNRVIRGNMATRVTICTVHWLGFPKNASNPKKEEVIFFDILWMISIYSCAKMVLYSNLRCEFPYSEFARHSFKH